MPKKHTQKTRKEYEKKKDKFHQAKNVHIEMKAKFKGGNFVTVLGNKSLVWIKANQDNHKVSK